MSEVILGLGSNLNNKSENIIKALENINRLIDTKVVEVSRLYSTKPVETTVCQDRYLNCCAKIETNLSEKVILGAVLGIEASLYRSRPFYHAPRTIDIDILLYDNKKIDTKELTLPHPRMLQRAFVLVPLKDIYNNCKALNVDFSDEYNKLDKSEIYLYEDKDFEQRIKHMIN